MIPVYVLDDETPGDLGVGVSLAQQVQHRLFDLGGELALPEQALLPEAAVAELDEALAQHNAALPPLKEFILPGGTPAGAYLHVARTVARRAERAAWTAVAVHGTDPAQEGAEKGTGGVSVLPGKYLNRLSDLLFILARSAAGAEGDVLWEPGGGRSQQPERHRGPRQEG